MSKSYLKKMAAKVAKSANKRRAWRHFGAAMVKYGALYGLCCAIADTGTVWSAGKWFSHFIKAAQI